MKLAICNETFRGWSFDETFRYARQLGYDGIEIAPFTIEKNAWDITPQRCQTIRSLADQHQLEIVGLHWLLAFTDGYHLTSPDPQVREQTGDYLTQLARVCHWLGGSIMVLGSPQQRNLVDGCSVEDGNSFAVDCIHRAQASLEELDVVLALEPLGPQEGNFLLTAAWAVELIERIRSSHVKLHLDVKAMSTESESMADIILQNRDYLVHFHANDANLRGPGMGDICYEPIIAALRKIDYQGWISVEVFDESLSPQQLASESIQYLQQQLA